MYTYVYIYIYTYTHTQTQELLMWTDVSLTSGIFGIGVVLLGLVFVGGWSVVAVASHVALAVLGCHCVCEQFAGFGLFFLGSNTLQHTATHATHCKHTHILCEQKQQNIQKKSWMYARKYKNICVVGCTY